jgi:serine/threonine protein kinase/formylglycine-generating enzyme required for sulfatase activity
VIERLSARSGSPRRYRPEGEIGRGGMGAVVRVWDEDLERPLAMKVMLGEVPAEVSEATPPDTQQRLARFLEEAQVTGQLDHPGIVPVHEIGLDAEGRVFFTMKLVRGRTLLEVFSELARDEGGWTQTRVLGLLLKVCEAMSYAHAKGVIHRDLKPANVMVGRFGEVYVMDWGLARVLGGRAGREPGVEPPSGAPVSSVLSLRHRGSGDTPPPAALQTLEGDIMGTPAYMSPEQARGQLDQVGPPTDVYALGAMLYQLLVGRPPPSVLELPGSGAGRGTALEAPLHELAPGTAPELEAICEKAMALDPAARYPDMSALAEDLSAYLEGRVVRAYETGAWAEARKWVRRNKPLAGALAAAVALLVLGLVSSLVLKAQSDANAEQACLKEVEAQEQRAAAVANAARAEAETAKVLRLSDVRRLQELEREAEDLWPPEPGRIADLEAWLARARALAGNLPAHRETLEQMRSSAAPWTAADREQDRRTHPDAAELAASKVTLEETIADLEAGIEGLEREEAERRVVELEARIGELEDAVAVRRTWRLATPEEQWQHDVLSQLVADLERLASGLLAEDALAAGIGWSVPRRLAFARALQQGFGPAGRHTRAWEQALPAIRAAYPGLEIAPQVGLVPLGPDPGSGLWEFGHLMSGTLPLRDADGRLLLEEGSGVVLVLLPGGTSWVGAQAQDVSAPNHDPEARQNEAPVHPVDLSPFLVSKYEMTQGQWLRLAGSNPSQYTPDNWRADWLEPPGPASLLHPVESVSWLDCARWLPRAGLALPTDAQLEYATRAGTDTPWWTGSERESLVGAANLADAHAREHGAGVWPGHELWLDDGATVHAPVGTYRPNAFGLHETVGNLWEWCLDGYDAFWYERSPRVDPLLDPTGRARRVNRGGSFGSSATLARSADRNGSPAESADGGLGVRPARRLDR